MKRFLNIMFLSLLLCGSAALQYGCSSAKKAVKENVDTDHDGLTNQKEQQLGTDPQNPDTDGDGLSDGDEVNQYDTDPLKADTDGDGLSDGKEVNAYETDPTKADSDDDGLKDGEEINKYQTDPNDKDSDGDGLNDADEVMKYKTDPNNKDTDGDGFTDSQEIEMNTDPNDADDPPFIDDSDLQTVNFEFDKSNITSSAGHILQENVQVLSDSPKFRVRVDAFTDHVGGDQYNLRLSKRRAISVKKFYTNNGINGSRIDIRGLGKAPNPCMNMSNQQGCRKNRRAETHPLNPYKYTPMMQ